MLVELDVGRARDLGLRRRGDELGVEALGERPERLHDALHVDDHDLDRAGEHGELLVQEVAGGRDAVAHQDLVAGAADAGEVDALRAGRLGLGDELGVARGLDQHGRERRLVAVDDDVDLVVLEHAEVDLADEGARRAEQDVADVGAQHGAAPAVGQGAAERGLEDVLGVQVHALVGAVHDLDDLTVDGARGDPQLAPLGLPLRRSPLGVDDVAVRLAELLEGLVGHVEGDLVDLAPLRGDAEVPGHGVQLLLVLDLVARGLTQGDGAQRHGHVAAVVGVGGHAGGHLAGEVARGDGAHVGAADAGLLLGVLADEAAGAHRADAAAGAGLADGARLHGVRAAERGADAALVGVRQHLDGGRVDALGGYRLGGVVGLLIHEATPSPACRNGPRRASGPGARAVRGHAEHGTVGDQYLRWSPDIVRSAGSVTVTRTPAVSHSGLSVGGASASGASPVG